MTELLTIHAVHKTFGGLRAINQLNLTVQQGEILSLIGSNGSGKSTLLNLVSGIYAPDSGSIALEGISISGKKPHTINQLGIARTFQNLRIFINMSVMENVLSVAYQQAERRLLQAIWRTQSFQQSEKRLREQAEDILAFFGSRLSGYRYDQPAYSLSYANRRRLEIARALMTQPKLLLLDEPAAGMNPHESAEIAELIVQIRDHFGCTIILVEHDMHVVATASERVIALNAGSKIAEGTYQTVISDAEVVASYLGTPSPSKGLVHQKENRGKLYYGY